MDCALQIQNHDADYPFKNHGQFALMADILSRKYKHNISLHLQLSNCATKYFLEAFLTFIKHEHIPTAIRNMQCYFLSTLGNDYQSLAKLLRETDQFILFIIDDAALIEKPSHFIALLNHHNCRCILLDKTNHKHVFKALFDHVNIAEEGLTDALAILQNEKTELEKYHQILIPEEVLKDSLSLTERFLTQKNALEDALLLLDSSAARSECTEHGDNFQIMPVLTLATIHQVLAKWIHIPIASEFDYVASLKKSIFGQDAAVEALISKKSKRHLLLSGQKYSGKKTFACKLTDAQYSNTSMLYSSVQTEAQSLGDLLFKSEINTYHHLSEILSEKPYAIILIEDIENLSASLLNELSLSLQMNVLLNCTEISLKHCRFIFTTRLGCERLQEITSKSIPIEEESVDLIKLVLDEDTNRESDSHILTADDLIKAIMPELTENLPVEFLQELNTIPFIPLTPKAIEQIIQSTLTDYAETLNAEHEIELSCALEVIEFITKRIMRNQTNGGLKNNIALLKQLIMTEIKHKPAHATQLHLQLNETGQMLTSLWVNSENIRQQA